MTEPEPQPLSLAPAPAEKPEQPHEEQKAIVEKIIDTLNETFKQEKAREIETLYNGFVDVITKSKAHISNILTAIELIKHDLILQKIEQIRREPTT